VGVIDALALREVDTDPVSNGIQSIDLKSSSAAPFWIVTNDSILNRSTQVAYVSDAQVGYVYIIDITPGSANFNQRVGGFAVPNALLGLRGMAMAVRKPSMRPRCPAVLTLALRAITPCCARMATARSAARWKIIVSSTSIN
jgi:hypothetical protein